MSSWQRVEGRSIHDDLLPGLAAQIADPLWMLARQWQFGEFQGEDVGSPVHVELAARSVSTELYRPNDKTMPQPGADRKQ